MTPTTNPVHVANMANAMSQTCKNEKLAMTLQYVAIGSMVVMGLAAATHMLKDMFGHRQHRRYYPGNQENHVVRLSGLPPTLRQAGKRDLLSCRGNSGPSIFD